MRSLSARSLVVALAALVITTAAPRLTAQTGARLATPAEFLGFQVGADNKLARWDKIVEYMRLVSAATDRVRLRELGKSTDGNPFIVLEIASPDTLKNLDRYKAMERKLYFQGGAPTDAERDEIFRQGKAVVVVTCSIHATEVGATQMSVELVHRLATDNSPQVKKILDNVIFLLVPSLNPDGEIMVTDWFNKNLGTPYEGSSIPYLYHPYVGHDNNRDMYMFTQVESRLVARPRRALCGGWRLECRRLRREHGSDARSVPPAHSPASGCPPSRHRRSDPDAPRPERPHRCRCERRRTTRASPPVRAHGRAVRRGDPRDLRAGGTAPLDRGRGRERKPVDPRGARTPTHGVASVRREYGRPDDSRGIR